MWAQAKGVVGDAADKGEALAKQAAKRTEGLGDRSAEAGERAAKEAVRPVKQAADAAPGAARELREKALEPGAQKIADQAVPATKQVTDGTPTAQPSTICCELLQLSVLTRMSLLQFKSFLKRLSGQASQPKWPHCATLST